MSYLAGSTQQSRRDVLGYFHAVPSELAPGAGRALSAIVCNCMNLTPFSAFLLLPVMIILLQLGHSLRLRRETAPQSAAIEGAVFALFGLLLAFTFSGAVSRYDAHRALVVEESNDIGTAYLRLDLLAPQDQPQLRELFRDYINSRLHLSRTRSPKPRNNCSARSGRSLSPPRPRQRQTPTPPSCSFPP